MQLIIKNWEKGLVTQIESESIARGSASDILNWHFLGDKIELRRGQKRLNATEITDIDSSVTGLGVGRRNNGTEIVYFAYLRKCLYINPLTNEATEIGTDIFSENSSGEDITFNEYNSLAGNFMRATSPNNSSFKFPTANPDSYVDMKQTTYKGKSTIKQSRMFLWDRKDDFGGSDKTGLYLSYIDQTENSYAFTSQEVIGTGDGTTTTFSGTLAFKASNSKESCFFLVIAGATQSAKTISAINQETSATITTSSAHGYAVGDTIVVSGVTGMTQINNRIAVITNIVDSTNFTVNIDSTDFTAYSSGGSVNISERFVDDKNGSLTSSQGGTGSINYATGVFSITFSTAVLSGSSIVAQYFREDSTNQGIDDFSFSVPRTIGQGASFRQDDGGAELMNVISFGADEYCMHKFKTWVLTLSEDDTNALNTIYRENVGIPYHRSAVGTGDGIFYVDVLGDGPAIRKLGYGRILSNVIPLSISDQLDLKQYLFDKSVVFEWGNYLCVSCRTNDSTINNRTLMYNKLWKSWEIHNFRVSDMNTYNGTLIAGDSGSPNVYTLFSGLSDDESIIDNYFISGNDNLSIDGTKVCNRLRLAGMIGDDQEYDIEISLDNAPFYKVFTVQGSASYVDKTQRKVVGNSVLGDEMIGGGSSVGDPIWASPYQVEFLIGSGKFNKIRYKIIAKKIGYVSVSEVGFVDIREKAQRLPTKYLD